MSEPVSPLDPRTRRFEKIWNTYVRVRLPWARTLHAPYWENRGLGEAHGPHQYIELQESSYALIDEVVRQASGPGAPILDVGCNVGRHLDALHQRGFTNLHGVDIQKVAIEHMARIFPEMAAHAHFQQGTFQTCLPQIPDSFFEVVFTHGATVELVPPSFPVCQHMARAARKAVVMVINENGHAFPRLWEAEFLRAGFVLTKLLRPVHAGTVTSLMVFQRMSSLS